MTYTLKQAESLLKKEMWRNKALRADIEAVNRSIAGSVFSPDMCARILKTYYGIWIKKYCLKQEVKIVIN